MGQSYQGLNFNWTQNQYSGSIDVLKKMKMSQNIIITGKYVNRLESTFLIQKNLSIKVKLF